MLTDNSEVNKKNRGLLSLILPMHNEAESVENIISIIVKYLDSCAIENYELIIIDDGSTDETLHRTQLSVDSIDNLSIIAFNRNFGKEAAIHAGLKHCKGDVAVVMDADGQHPASLLPTMVEQWLDGYDVVSACKSNRGTESYLSKTLAMVFYCAFKFLTKIDVRDVSDYMLLDRKVIDQYCRLFERQRFFRGMITWMGFTTKKVYFDVNARKNGQPSWTRFELIRFASNAIAAFSSAPLQIITLASMLYTAFAVIVGIQTLYMVFSGNAETGFTTVILLILITGSIIMFGLGQVGLYIKQILDEIKNRPSYIVNERKSVIRDRKLRSE